MKNYIIKEEPFGFVIYNRKKLSYKLIKKDRYCDYLKNNNIQKNDTTLLSVKRKDFRNDILYSPVRIYYELTLLCNLHCRYCFNNSGKSRIGELNTNDILKSLDHLRECNVIDIRFTGGEPTCRKDWYEILSYAKKLGFCISCNTNAVFSNSSVCEKFAKLGLEQVTVSVDGNEEHHDFNRGKGSYQKMLKNLKQMSKMGVALKINTLINKRSINDVEFLIDLASKYVAEVNFFTIVYIGRGSHLEISDGVTVDAHLKMSERINKLKPKYPNLKILHFAESTKMMSINESGSEELGIKIGPPSGTTTFNILSNGDYACGGYVPYIINKFQLGNIKTDSLFDVWQKSAVLEEMRKDGRKLIAFCNKCDKYQKAQCQGSKYEIELNRLFNPNVKNPTCIYGDGPSLLTY